MNPQELLYEAAQIIDQRGQGYGGIENNFQLAADLASLRLGRDFHPYEIAIILACVKNARAFASPNHLDSHVDAMNYEMFAATFASSRVSLNTVEVCSWRKMALIDGISASCPVTTGQGLCGLQYPTPLRDDKMPMLKPS